MANTLKEFEKLLHLALDRKVTLHRKLMMYLLCLILAALGILLLLLTAIGGPLKAEPQIAQAMESQLHTTYDKVSEEMETYTGYSLHDVFGTQYNDSARAKQRCICFGKCNDKYTDSGSRSVSVWCLSTADQCEQQCDFKPGNHFVPREYRNRKGKWVGTA